MGYRLGISLNFPDRLTDGPDWVDWFFFGWFFRWRARRALWNSVWFGAPLELILAVVRNLLYGLTTRPMIGRAGLVATRLPAGLRLLFFTLGAYVEIFPGLMACLPIGVRRLTQWARYIMGRSYAMNIFIWRMIL